MSNITIIVENPGKKYLIKHEQKESYQTFQDMLLNGSKNFINFLNLFHRNAIKDNCKANGIKQPVFEERQKGFQGTLYSGHLMI